MHQTKPQTTIKTNHLTMVFKSLADRTRKASVYHIRLLTTYLLPYYLMV